MDYRGRQEKMQPGELAELANEFGLTEAHVRTVIEVETAGKAFNSVGWPYFLFEPHKYYQNVPKSKLAEAIKQGLAYPTWKGPGSYPKTPQLRVQQFLKAAALDETAAIKSASWGLGQIMGSECLEAGYNSPQEMLQAFMDSEANQVRGMLNLIKHRKLDRVLLQFPNMEACHAFARKYNGAAYAKNNYHNKLHDAYVRLSKKLDIHATTEKADDGSIRFGDKDDTPNGPVYTLQKRLRDLGYSLKVDGDFGGGTRAAVLAWKANEGIDTSSPDMSLADLEMLKQSSPMPIPQERATATVEDVKPISPIVQKTSLGQKILAWLGLGSAGVGVLGTGQEQGGSLLDKAQDAADKASQARGVWDSFNGLLGESGILTVLKLMYEWRFPLLLVAVVVGFVMLRRIQADRVEMHRRAEIG
jgi:hypothetical protein